jgi:hypothetical protein
MFVFSLEDISHKRMISKTWDWENNPMLFQCVCHQQILAGIFTWAYIEV